MALLARKTSRSKYQALFYVKVLICIGAILLAVAVFVHFYVLPLIIKNQITKAGALVNGSESFPKWISPHYLLSVYIFNVTNPEEVTQGETPKLQEVGPYVYDYQIRKMDVSFEEDTVQFRESFSSHFNPTLSHHLRPTDIVTMMDFALMGTILAAEGMANDQMDRVRSMIENIYPNRKTPFVSAPVGNILFDGLPLDCSAKMSMVFFICRQLTIMAPGQFWMDENRVHRFAFLHNKNMSNPDLYKQNTGESDGYQRGLLTSFRNETTLKVWASPYCNMLNGSSDASVYPLGLSSAPVVYYFDANACRSFAAEYNTTDDYKGLSVLRFQATETLLESAAEVPANECFCPHGLPEAENDTDPLFCPPKGTFSLASCTQVPVLLSFPWFMYGEKDLLKGMFANASVHNFADLITYILIEPLTSMPVSGRRRIQFNLELRSIPAFSYLRKVTPRIVPGLWMEEAYDVDLSYLEITKRKLSLIYAMETALYVLMGAGIAIMLSGGVLHAFHWYSRGTRGPADCSKVSPMSLADMQLHDVDESSDMTAHDHGYSTYAASYQEHFM